MIEPDFEFSSKTILVIKTVRNKIVSELSSYQTNYERPSDTDMKVKHFNWRVYTATSSLLLWSFVAKVVDIHQAHKVIKTSPQKVFLGATFTSHDNLFILSCSTGRNLNFSAIKYFI